MVSNCKIQNAYQHLFNPTSGLYPRLSFMDLKHRLINDRIYDCFDQEEYDALRIAFRIRIDPYYDLVYNRRLSVDDVYHAGFFDDGEIESYFLKEYAEVQKMVTPFHIVKAALEVDDSTEDYAVLLTTGSFAPVHIGHVAMMEKAKERVQQAGYKVLGGYFSPSHDNYVSLKDDGKAKMHVLRRIQLLELALKDKEWLQVDPWEGLYNSVAINFTEVIEYLELYLNYHLKTSRKRRIHVFYVFGSDYMKFAESFREKGKCVIVPRAGYDVHELGDLIDDSRSNRILVSNPSVERVVSSTSVRNGHVHLLPQAIRSVYLDSIKGAPKENRTIALRDDAIHSLKNWVPLSGFKLERVYYEVFRQMLIQAICQSYGMNEVDILPITAKTQLGIVKFLSKEKTVISLDAVCKAEYNVRLSRVYSLAGNQISRLKQHVISQDSLEGITGPVVLIDDDIVSGKTMDYVINNILPKSLGPEIISLFEYGYGMDEHFPEIYEILDERDFLFGAKDGGLVAELPNGDLTRVPYVLPFVNPTWRCQVNPDQALDFSRKVILANLQFFSHFPEIKLSSLDEINRKVFEYTGFGPNTTMLEIVGYYWGLLNIYPT
ncbi:MAG: hypothetical protein ACRCXZ_05980 [Patescibacteria group bacterium]